MKKSTKRIWVSILPALSIVTATAGTVTGSKVTVVNLETIPSGIEVYVDGYFRGSSPVSWNTSEGRHSLEFRNGDRIFTEEVWVSGTSGDTVSLGPFFVEPAGNISGQAESQLFPEISDPFPYLLPGAEGEFTSYDRITHLGHEKLDLAMQLYYEKSYGPALSMWRRLVDELPYFTDICIYRAGLCLCGLGEYEAAIVEFGRVCREYPGSYFSGLCYYQLGRCFLALGDRGKGAGYLSRFIEENPGHPLVSHAETLRNSNEPKPIP